ncbi:MAG: GtrA family protein [Blastocatellia bacterium]|nr:GtrA family protein [Blastocatellia bacterium]
MNQPLVAQPEESLFLRWLKFNFVGLGGMIVQSLLLAILANGLGWRDSLALVIGVECAVINNFFWHEKWTWKERKATRWRERILRFGRFNITNGLVSIGGAWMLMELLHERCHLPNQLVNLISIVACSMVNFGLSHVVVFRRSLAEETISAKAAPAQITPLPPPANRPANR